jgi:hypothetical protein
MEWYQVSQIGVDVNSFSGKVGQLIPISGYSYIKGRQLIPIKGGNWLQSGIKLVWPISIDIEGGQSLLLCRSATGSWSCLILIQTTLWILLLKENKKKFETPGIWGYFMKFVVQFMMAVKGSIGQFSVEKFDGKTTLICGKQRVKDILV